MPEEEHMLSDQEAEVYLLLRGKKVPHLVEMAELHQALGIILMGRPPLELEAVVVEEAEEWQ